jgi:dTDP-4-dehydrorhamnose reductase
MHTVIGIVNQHSLRGQPFEVSKQDLLADGAVAHILDESKAEWVIHCAAQANVDLSESDPDLTMRLNGLLPGVLAKETARRGLRLVHISTDAVFDGQRGNYTEADTPNPLSVYARSKLEAEERVLSADPNAVVARVNLFGWSLNGRRSLGEFFVGNLAAGRAVKGFTDVLFCPVLVNDLNWVLLQILEQELSGLYHAVSRTSTTKYAFGVAVARRFGLPDHLIEPASVEQAGLAARRSPRLTLDTMKLAMALGTPLPDWQAGLERFYALWKEGYAEKLQTMG